MVADAVHREGGRIYVQLSHLGRLSRSYFAGLPPVAPSAVPVVGFIRTPKGLTPYETPWVPSTSEVQDLVDEFRPASQLARADLIAFGRSFTANPDLVGVRWY